MKINLKKALLCFGIVASSLQGNSQNQQWVLPPKNYNLSSATPAISNIASPSASTAISNGAYDSNGNLLFYILGTSVYKPGSSSSLGSLPNCIQAGGDAYALEIVPVPGKENCNMFYVLYENSTGLCYVTITYNAGSITSNPTLNTVYPNNSDSHIIIANSPYHLEAISPFVISKLTATNKRYLFLLGWGATNSLSGIYRITIDGNGITTPSQIASNNDLKNTASGGVGFFDGSWNQTNQLIYQMSLSPDQTRLGWGGGIVEGFNNNIYTYMDQYVYEIKLNSYSLASGSYQFYTLSSGLGANVMDEVVAGFTYDAAGHMYASTRSGIYYSTGYNSPFNKISGSSAYTYNASNTIVGSQLQYATSSNLVIGVNPTSTDQVGKFFSMNNGAITANYLSGNTTKTNGEFGGIRTVGEFLLPSQISGDVIIYPSYVPSISIANAPICKGSSIMMNGNYTMTGNTAPNYYYWEIDQCTDQNGSNPTLVSSASSTTPFGNSFPIPGSNALTCGNYYKIVYGVSNTSICVPTVTTSIIVKVNCPDVPVITGNTNICLGSSTTLTSNYVNSPRNNIINWSSGGVSLGSNQSITVSPSATTTYDLTATYVPTGCGSTTSFVVNVVQNNPDFTYVTNYTSPNNFFTVSATPVVTNGYSVSGFGDLWVVEQIDPVTLATIPNTSTATQNPTCWWSYYPNANVFGGFDGTKSSGINNVNCGPPVSPLNGMFLNGATYRITRGTWNSICLWAQISHIITVSGHRPVNSNSTLDESTVDFSYLRNSNNFLLPNDTKLEESLVTIYPNPSTGNFTVETKETTPQLLQVFDVTGKLVISQTISGNANIQGDYLPSGIYTVKITGAENTTNKRIIIAK